MSKTQCIHHAVFRGMPSASLVDKVLFSGIES